MFWVLFAATVALWWFTTPAAEVKGSTGVFLAAGRITGLISGFILLVMIVMMARIRWIEFWFGGRGLLNWHRAFGGALVVLTIIHATCLVIAYAREARQPALSQAWAMLTTLEHLAAAAAAAGLLIVTVLLSARLVRRGLPYWLWHGLHLSGYAVVPLAYGHQLTLGTAVLRPGPARWYWIGLHLLVGGCLLWGRILRPVWFNARHRFRVVGVVDEIPGWVSCYLAGRRMDQVLIEAGQYLHCRFLIRGCWWQAYPFSVSTAPTGDWLRVSVMAFDSHTSKLQQVEPATRVLLSEPAGCFTASRRTREKALIIAGGTGIAPAVSLLHELPAETVVLYWAPCDQAVVFREELERLGRERRAKIYFVLGGSDDDSPRLVFSTAGFRELVPDLGDRDVYLCGPRGLVDRSTKMLRRLGLSPRQLHFDRSVL